MVKFAAVAGFALVFLGAVDVFADDKPESALPARAAAHHSIAFGNHRLDYDSIVEIIPLTDAKGATTAAIDTISYLVDAAASGERPVSFVFNGGPGAASVFLHLGALGPRIMQTPENGAVPGPPVRLVDNPATWLRFTDLVFVDPVGTGFSRGKGKEENPDKPFWEVRADIASLETVVRLWLTRHQRWSAPVFLAGESYGGFRAAAMAEALPRDVGVTVNGLVLISPALDISALHQDERDILAAAFMLPSYAAAAAAWYPQSLGDDSASVEGFALCDYLVGLAALKGQPSPADPFIARVAELAGLPVDIVRRYRGRIPRRVFAREVRRAAGEVVSLYDAMIARPARAEEGEGAAGDPVLLPAAAAYGAAFNAYAAEELGYRTDEPYRVLAGDVSRLWNWQDERRGDGLGRAMTALESTLLEHPGTKLLIANGHYDLVTPYLASRWLVDQLEVPTAVRAGIRLRVYAGGHMMYLRPDSRSALAKDAAELFATPDATSPLQ
jgi:carboxypeptidase C (cathepsin A)